MAEKIDAGARRPRPRAAASSRFGIRLHVIVRETDEEAWAAADELISHVDDETIATAQNDLRADGFGRPAADGALHGGRRDKLEVSPNLWAGVGLVRGGAGTALVGDPETVAARMKEYMALGIDTFILSGYPHLEEAYRFAELVFPLLPLSARTGTRRRSAVNTGPFGETIANEYRPRATGIASHEPSSTVFARRHRTAAGRRPDPMARAARAPAGLGARLRAPAGCRRACCRRRAPSALAFWDAAAVRRARSQHVWVSPGARCIGLAIGGGIGFALGLLNGLSRLAEKLLDTTLQMLRNIPHLALIPLVILWFGIDEEAKLFLVAVGVFFPIYLNTFHGIRTVDRGLIEMARIYGLSRWPVPRVILPGALPSILVGLRYALGIMWLTLIVAETISASSGIGYMTMNAREFLQTDVVVLGILVYALLGKLADSASRALERLRCPGIRPSRNTED